MHQQHRNFLTIWSGFRIFSAGLLALAAGCSKPAYDVRPVKGTVRVDGRPLTAGRIMFAPAATGSDINAGKPAFGHIDSDGAYMLTTYSEGDGAVVGEHSVTLFGTGDSPKFSRLTLPTRKRVEAISENVIDFDVSAEVVKRYGVKE